MSLISTTIARDVKHTFRIWARQPGIMLTALVTLAIGTGATTTIFSIINGLYLKPLPLANPNRVVHVVGTNRATDLTGMSLPDVLDIKRRSHLAQYFACYRQGPSSFSRGTKASGVLVLAMDADLFRVIGLGLARGHAFTSEANQSAHFCEVAVSWNFWKSQLGGAPIENRRIELDKVPCRVAGVLARGLDLPIDAEIWKPLEFNLQDRSNQRITRSLEVLALLRAGVRVEDFNAELERISSELSHEYPLDNEGISAHATPIRQWLTQAYQRSVWLLFAAVSGLLLMACANVANLLLSRSSSRIREVAVRYAVGADQGQLFAQLMVESFLLALAASISGLLISWISIEYLSKLSTLPISGQANISLDWRVLVFSVGTASFVALLFGTVPALRVSAASFTSVLVQAGGRISESRAQQTLRRFLIFIETTIATALLVVCFLLTASFLAVNRVNTGFQSDHILTAYLSLDPTRYTKESNRLGSLARRVVEELTSMPGIQDAALTTDVPIQLSAMAGRIVVEGGGAASANDSSAYVLNARVTPGFRKTLRIPLLQGRDLSEEDFRPESSSVLVNQTFTRIFFPRQNAVGRRFRFRSLPNTSSSWEEIAGVIGDTKQDGLEAKTQPEVFAPMADSSQRFPAVVIRTRDDPKRHLSDIEKAVYAVDPSIPVFYPRTGDEIIARRLGIRAFNTTLIGIFAAIAMVMAAGGIFAAIAYATAQRTSEIAVRMACGATSHKVVRLVIRQGVGPALLGIAAGLVLALLANQFLAGLLYGISPLSWPPYVSACVVLAFLAWFAAWLPARRAARVDPWRALRYE